MGLTGVVQVLVVNDEPSIVDAVATALRDEGYDVAEARSGRGGLSAAQSGSVDLIVLDGTTCWSEGFPHSTPVIFAV